MLLKLLGAFCVLATASPLLVSTVALGSDNFLNIVQDGNTHSGLVVQSGLGNQAGTATLPVHQQGVFDDLALTQSGDDNTIGLTGRGLVQDGTGSTDGSAANRATILQQSNGNSIGELVQTTLGTHASTGNFLTVNQLTGGSNTVGSIEQVQGSGASANVADFTQNGLSNWLQMLSQNTASGDGDNHVTLSITGDYNGIDPGNMDGAGPLAILARSAGASSSEIVQDGDLSGGAANAISLTVTGSFNQFGMTQLGVDNSAEETITGLGNSFAAYQLGTHNQLVSGGIAGDGNDLGVRQRGDANVASAVLNWSSSYNEVGIGQDGDSNTADIALKGDHGTFGVSQNGNGHFAQIAAIGNGNVVLGIQINAGLTASVGNSLTVGINGDGNNGLDGSASQSFTGPALAAAQTNLSLSRALVVAPDPSLLLGSLAGGIRLVPGLLVQWGEGNGIDIEVGSATPSNGNLFAAVQKGNGNLITASVDGNYNQFVVVQQGNDDDAAIYQAGDGNVAVILQ